MLKLEPKNVWDHFENLCNIPRPSGHEEAVGKYLASVAQKHGLSWQKDAVGNVVIRVPASPGKESSPVTVLQGHTDMVCEKNSDTAHDFLKDPIRPRVDGDWVKATGTTLGADNGIGVAMALALLDEKEIVHPPLELLFTIDEETGLNGANGLKPGFLKGRRLLNLDTEEDGQLYVGCAGGIDTVITLKARRDKTIPRKNVYRIGVKGLRGGHSGGDIHEGRGNANQLLVRSLWAMEDAGAPFRLISFDGGSKRNAIPREAFATLVLTETALAKGKKALKAFEAAAREELRGVDEGLSITISASKADMAPLAETSQAKLLCLLGALPHGYVEYSREIHGLVQTSTNFAIVTTRKGEVEVCTSQRSSVWSRLMWASRWVESVGLAGGAKVEHSSAYPGWKPNLESPILKQAQATYKRLYGVTPEPKAIHAGLECGIIGAKYPGMDMVSMGPEIRNAHSPDEAVSISSVEKTYVYLKELLKDLAG
jgi:dipeptidase D